MPLQHYNGHVQDIPEVHMAFEQYGTIEQVNWRFVKAIFGMAWKQDSKVGFDGKFRKEMQKKQL